MGVWHTYSTRQTLSELETDKSRGLSGAEAERRLARWGPNCELSSMHKKTS